MSSVEKAVYRFKEGSLCSQSVFSTYAEKLGLDLETAMKIATPFGGGMARLGETCGTVSGALMAIGLKHGNITDWRIEDRQKEKTYRLAIQFVDEFKSRNGSIRCKDILGCDLSTPEGRKTAGEKDLIVTVCPKFVRDAAEILEEIL
ncbi:MAG: C_GCAxxG_C_C family protein [Firmicutes bacterium]|nr:C_GCAxxG_C_C family protein [Bacillota bacterium]